MAAPSTDKAAIRQVIRALKAGGWSLTGVDDGGDYVTIGNDSETEAIEAIMAVDEATLAVHRNVEGGRASAWVWFVMGNEPFEVVADHSTDLSPILDALAESWEA